MKAPREVSGFALHAAVYVLDALTWRIHRGEIISAKRQGQYLIRLADGREQYFQPPYIKLTHQLPQPSLF